MKNRSPCPKCGHRKILFLPRLADRTGSTHASPMVAHVASPGMLTFLTDGILGPHTHGQIAAYICRRCGFTELYTSNPKKIPVADIEGAEIVVAEEEEEEEANESEAEE